jgi:hypothetical protein
MSTNIPSAVQVSGVQAAQTLLGRGYLPSSTASIAKFRVVVAASSSDDKLVTNPANSAALNGGKNFVGIATADRTVDATGQDATGTEIQVAGVARCSLKTNIACVKGDEAGYDPADDGLIQPITASNRGKLVPIGRFDQSKASSSDVQSVGVVLLVPGRGAGVGALSVAIADGTALTNSVVETTLGSMTIPAGFVQQVGQTFDIMARVDVTSGNATDTLILKAYIGSTLIGSTAAVDVTNGGGDIGIFKLSGVVRVAGASGKFYVGGEAGLGVPATATMCVTGSVGEASVDWTAAQTIAIKGVWSAASASNSCKLTMLTVKAGF